MEFAVLSDSHGHMENVSRLAARLNRSGVRTAIHLGDDYDDAAALLAAGIEVHRVPGVFSPYYQDETVPNRLLMDLGDLTILLTHADAPHDNDRPEDEDPAAIAVREKPDLVLFGHTHQPAIEERSGVLWVNPGHLKPEDKKGHPPSYALIDTEKQPIGIRILALEDEGLILEK